MSNIDVDKIIKEYEALNKLIYFEDGFIVFSIVQDYEININRCDTKEKILEWVLHLTQKPWMNKELLNRFIHVAYSANGFTRK